MSKIEFEDRTRPQDKIDAEIELLASSYFNGAIRVGILAGFSSNEIIKAFLIAANDLCNYIVELGSITEEDIKDIRQRADEISKERAQTLRESGLLDTVKRAIDELKGKEK